jgi:uncharacterized protein YkwD
MARIRLLRAALITTAALLLAPFSASAGTKRQMIKSINHARKRDAIRGVHFSRRLSRGAAAWARHLMQTSSLYHAGLSAGEGEVIEWHTGGAAHIRQVVREWLNSPTHRQIMLARGYHHAGAGHAVGNFGGQWSTIWVVRFS